MQKEMMIGNTHIIIDDSCCRDVTPEQRARIMQRVSNIAYQALIAQEAKKKQETAEENHRGCISDGQHYVAGLGQCMVLDRQCYPFCSLPPPDRCMGRGCVRRAVFVER